MIKEKHEKGPEGPKEEPTASDKDSTSSEVRVKKEDDIKKEPTSNAITKNGGIVGSTNTGSVQGTPDRKPDVDDTAAAAGVPDTGAPLAMKQEDSVDGDGLTEAAFGLGGPGPGGGPPADSGQPLPSNVKPPTAAATAMEVHYMQQQSQIFVFSTMLANSGAEEVQLGRYPSIIAYHCAQPGTKKYLEKNPLKVTQFNRQNPAQWLNSLAMMKGGGGGGSKGCVRSPGLGAPKGGPPPAPSLDSFLGADALDDMVGLGDGSDAPWESKPHLDGLDGAVANGLPPDIDSPSLGGMQPKLQGVQVPDENLTPQQRQHRVEKLVTMRKLQQMLFPESQGGEGGGQDPSQAGQPPPPQQQQQQAGPPQAQQQAGAAGQQAQASAAACEWQRQQQQRQMGAGQGGPGAACSASVVPVGPGSCGPPTSGQRGGQGQPGQRLQGPPPPYHQTPRSASVPIALQSPSPASPNNPTSNLSLPSPRASSSALNSPADPNRPPFGGLTRHMSTGHSPTSQDSPSGPRLNHSNPGTPLSAHLSPSVSNLETPATVALPQTSDPIFGRSMTSRPPTSSASCTGGPSSGGPGPSQGAPGQQGGSGPQPQTREPNLMPVPSPQQIQYLNTFEGQELIIQKQPNTGLKEGSMISPPVLPSTGMDNANFPTASQDMPPRGVSGPNTPTSAGGPQFPPTPSVSNDGCRFSIPSPHTPTASTGEGKVGRMPMGTAAASAISPTGAPGPGPDLKNDLFPTPSPHMMDVPRFPGPNQGPNASPGAKMGGGFGMTVSPQGKPSPLELPNYCSRGDNVPLNPNCTSSMSGNPKVSHFDPISSLAQMSQQLTNSVASSLNGQGAPMMNFGSPSGHMMDMPGCHGNMGEMDQNQANAMMGMGPMQGPPHGFHPGSPMGPLRSLSPKLGGPAAFPNHMPMPRMVGRLPGPPGPNPYNGANVQVKPNAPNTIQYLPAKPAGGGAPGGGPRGPPSLDFLTRLAGPMGMMDKGGGVGPGGMPSPGQGYFGGGPPHMGHLDGGDGGPGPGGPMGPMMGNGGLPGMPMGGPGGPMMMRGGPGGPPRPVMRGLPPQLGGGHSHGPGPGGPFGGEPMFGGGGPPHPQMFVGGPKGSPMALGGPPDASQPLPPSMGQAGPGVGVGQAPFKGGCAPFVGPATADPNYAQQFHNFQQQLYATNTRSQMGGPPAMGPGPGPPPPHMQQPPYFNPK